MADLGDEFIVIGQVGSAMDAAIGAMAAGQIGLEGLGLGHLHHLPVYLLLGRLRAGAGRAATLLNLLTEETLKDASKSRRCSGVGVWLVPHRHHRRNGHLEDTKEAQFSGGCFNKLRNWARYTSCHELKEEKDRQNTIKCGYHHKLFLNMHFHLR